MKYLDCYAPIRIDRHPLVDESIFEKIGNKKYTILHRYALKPSILSLLDAVDLSVDSIILWQWNLSVDQLNPPHTDGDYRFPSIARSTGINWLIEGESVLDFWDKEKLNPIYGEQDEIYYTAWHNPNNITPDVTCSTFPAIVNPQIPHRVRSINGSIIRKSVVVYFKDQIPFKEMQKRLSSFLISPRLSNEIFKKK